MIDNKKRLAKDIVKTLNKAGFLAYFAGGCVRDIIMRKRPFDYDIATDASPKEVMELFKKTIPVGVQFGVVIVVVEGCNFEVATFRSDNIYEDSRHPTSVCFSSPEEDARRRDFTINGIFYEPIKRKYLDFVSGKEDIRKKIIRTIGNPDQRFSEDALRLIRAVRFASGLGFKIEEETFESIRKNSNRILAVSPERIRTELVKIFTGKNGGKALELLDQTSLLKIILPEVSSMKGVKQPQEFHPEGDVFTHTKLMMDNLKSPSTVLSFSCLLHDVGKPATFKVRERIRFDLHDEVSVTMADKICRRLKFSNDEREKILTCIQNHMKFMSVKKMRIAKLKRLMQNDTFWDELELHRLDCLASHGDLSNWRFLKRKYTQYKKEELKPKPLINGADLIALGYTPGPIFKKILNEAYELQLENRFRDKGEVLEWVENKWSGFR